MKKALHVFTLAMTFFVFLVYPGRVQSATRQWNGAMATDVNTAGNWSPASVPGIGDTAEFAAPGNKTPEFIGTTSSAFKPDLVLFDSGNFYTFLVTSNGGNPNTTLQFNVTGVQNTSLLTQLFNVIPPNSSDTASVVFNNSSSASVAGSDPIIYTLGQTSISSGNMTFNNSSNAGDSVIIAENASTLIFNGTSNAPSATVTLSDTSTLTSNHAMSIGTLNTDSNTLLNLGGQLTLTGLGAGGDMQINGPITGVGGITWNSGNNLTLLGLNNYSGGTVINNGEIIGNTNSLQGVIDINGPTIRLSFNQSFPGVFNGTVTGSGLLSFDSSFGTVFLNNNSSSFTGNTFADGTLILNGILGGGSLFIPNTGTLAGTGTYLGSVNLFGGNIAPGLGTFTISGDYTQTGGQYIVEVNETQSSLLDIGGVANIASNAAVLVVVDALSTTTQSYTILHADGGVVGKFSGAGSLNPVFVYTLSYPNPNDVVLTVENILSFRAQTYNQKQVAAQLATFFGSVPPPFVQGVLLELFQLPLNEYLSALDQMTAQQYTNALLIADLANNKFIRRLYDPLRNLITKAPCCNSCDCNPYCSFYDCSPYYIEPWTTYCGQEFDVWVDWSGGRTFVQGVQNARGFKMRSYEVSLGVQTTFYDCLTAGLAACYEKDDIHFNVGGKGRNNTWLGAVYGLYRPACFYALADLVLGYTKQKVRRPVNFGSFSFCPHSKLDIFQSTLYLEAGQDMGWSCLLVQPFVGLQVGYFNHNQIREKGNNFEQDFFNVTVHKKTHADVQSRLGMHFTTQEIWSCITASLDTAWLYRFTKLNNRSRQHFNEFGTSYTIKGLHLQNSSFEAAVNLSASIFDNVDLYVEAYGRWWDRATSYDLITGIQASW